MFEKFTEKAIDIVKSAQIYAIENNQEKIYPEHLLLALLDDNSSIIVKTFSVYKIEISEIKEEIKKLLKQKSTDKVVEFVSFSESSKEIFLRTLDIAKILGNVYIKPEHLFLAIWDYPKLELTEILKQKGLDMDKIKTMLYNVLSANKHKKVKHPESIEKRRRVDRSESIFSLIESSDSSKIRFFQNI